MARYEINKTFEVARVGEWNGSHITSKMLQEVVKNNSSAKSPIIRGHVNYPSGAESEGHIENPRILGDRLLFDGTLYDDLAKDYESNKFINHSVEIKPYTSIGAFVPALALLGAVKPGMKGLQVFSEKEDTILYFNNEIIKKEVTMSDYKTGYQDGLSAGKLESEKASVKALADEKVKFSESETDLKQQLKEANEKILVLETANKTQIKEMFSELADEKVKDLAEDKRKEKKEKIMKFSEKCETVDEFKEYLSEVNFKDTKAKLPENTNIKFSEEDQNGEFNYNDQKLKCY